MNEHLVKISVLLQRMHSVLFMWLGFPFKTEYTREPNMKMLKCIFRCFKCAGESMEDFYVFLKIFFGKHFRDTRNIFWYFKMRSETFKKNIHPKNKIKYIFLSLNRFPKKTIQKNIYISNGAKTWPPIHHFLI